MNSKRILVSRRDFVAGGLVALGCAVGPIRLFAAEKEIRIVYATEFLPMSYLDSDNKITGFYVDLIDEILGRQMGFNVLHIGLPWKRAQLTVKNGDAEGFCTHATSKRRAYMNFCDEMVIESRKAVFFHPGSDLSARSEYPIPIEDLKQYHHLNYLGNEWAEENLKDVEIEWVVDLRSVLRMIAVNRPGIIVTGEFGARYRIKQLGLTDRLRFRPVTITKKSIHRFGLRKTFADSEIHLQEFCRILKRMKSDGSFETILGRYL